MRAHVQVRPGSHIQPHQTSQEEKEREAMHGMVLGEAADTHCAPATASATAAPATASATA